MATVHHRSAVGNASPDSSRPFAALPRYIADDPAIHPTDKTILLVLAGFAWGNRDSCWPSNQTIAERVICTPEHIQRRLRALELRGLIKRQKGAPNRTGRLIRLCWRSAGATSALPESLPFRGAKKRIKSDARSDDDRVIVAPENPRPSAAVPAAPPASPRLDAAIRQLTQAHGEAVANELLAAIPDLERRAAAACPTRDLPYIQACILAGMVQIARTKKFTKSPIAYARYLAVELPTTWEDEEIRRAIATLGGAPRKPSSSPAPDAMRAPPEFGVPRGSKPPAPVLPTMGLGEGFDPKLTPRMAVAAPSSRTGAHEPQKEKDEGHHIATLGEVPKKPSSSPVPEALNPPPEFGRRRAPKPPAQPQPPRSAPGRITDMEGAMASFRQSLAARRGEPN